MISKWLILVITFAIVLERIPGFLGAGCNECQTNKDCGKGRICVEFSCGRICKPAIGVCLEACKTDADCGKGKYCIRTGCGGHVCETVSCCNGTTTK